MTKRFFSIFVVFAAAILALGCEVSDGSDFLSDGSVDDDDDDDNGNGSDSDARVCDGQDFKIKRAPVRLMIVLDASTSMLDGGKWEQAVSALTGMLGTFEGQNIHFGLDLYPNDDGLSGCIVTGPLKLDCAPDNEQKIVEMIEANDIFGLTPLWCELNNFASNASYAPAFMAEDSVPKYMVVVSDGGDTCNVACQPNFPDPQMPSKLGQITSQLLNMSNIKTFVIGFGGDVAPNELNAIAGAGGTPFPFYFDAADGVALEGALSMIAETVISCIYDIEEPDATADPEQVNFFFDGELVAHDNGCEVGAGWTWADSSHTVVEFCQKSCDTLRDWS